MVSRIAFWIMNAQSTMQPKMPVQTMIKGTTCSSPATLKGKCNEYAVNNIR